MNTKKIYCVSMTVPGNIGGGEIRNFNIIKQLIKKTDAEIEVFCTSTPDNMDVHRKNFERMTGVKCHTALVQPRSLFTTLRAFIHRVPPFMEDFKSSGIGSIFRAACEKSLPDIVTIEQLHAYYCIEKHIPWLKRKGVKIVFDCHNIEFQSFKDSLELFSLFKKISGLYLTPGLRALEIKATKQSDIVLACSTFDADFFRTYNPHTHVIANGVDCSEFRKVPKQKKAILFMGSTGYPPNADGIEYYLKEIHPHVVKGCPEVELLLVGADNAWLEKLGIKDVTVTPLGFVESIQPYLDKAMIGICPIRYGSGTRIKILTYMAASLPVVSTAKGAEGIQYVNNQDIILTDQPHQFSEAILKLLKNEIHRNTIGRNGRNFVEKNYDWDVIGKDLAQIYNI